MYIPSGLDLTPYKIYSYSLHSPCMRQIIGVTNVVILILLLSGFLFRFVVKF